MRILIGDLPVVFPYTLVFNQQVQYMSYLNSTLDSTGHALLEMPTGTGKTISLLALLTSYLAHRAKFKKLIYCTRTVVQMEKTLKELKSLLKRRKIQQPDSKKFLCIGLTAKKNLCVHQDIEDWRATESVQGQCKKRTAEWNRGRKFDNQQEKTQNQCQFYQNFRDSNTLIERTQDHQVFTMEDLRLYGREKIKCPYFLARQALKEADIVVFNYLYLIDPKISPDFIKKLSKNNDTIVVFDEAHNIDDICIDAYTLHVNKRVLGNAEQNVNDLQSKLLKKKVDRQQKYEQQFNKLLAKLKQSGKDVGIEDEEIDVIKQVSIPKSIMNSQDFLAYLLVIINFLRNKLKGVHILYYDNPQFCAELRAATMIEENFFKLANQKLNFLLQMLQIAEVQALKYLSLVTLFCQLTFMHRKGFKIVFQPTPMDGKIGEPLLTLACLDCSLSMKPIWKGFPSVILTSGTISPLDLYPKILDFNPITLKSINIELGRNPISPIIVGATPTQKVLSSEYVNRNEIQVSKAYGAMLIGLCSIVPDGMLCFFPSYMYMEHILNHWYKTGIISKLLEHRYVFIEQRDASKTEENILKFRKACDIGRGAIYLAIARGKIAEGVDFEGHYGRCVIMMGFPVQNSLDPVLLERIRFMIENKQIKDKNQFFQFDAMKQTAQCLGRVVRKKTDYGLMILADSRFKKQSRYSKLPKWILKCLQDQNMNATMETVLYLAAEFFRKMGKKFILNQKHYKTQQDFQKT